MSGYPDDDPDMELTGYDPGDDEGGNGGAPAQPGSVALATVDAVSAPSRPARTFNREQLDLIKRTVAAGTSDDEFALFIEVCRQTGLNPFQRQIYAIMRRQNDGGQWVNKMTIQTGIDGYRLLAARTGALAGIDDPLYDTEDGDHPNRATCTVYRLVAGQRMPFSATARWREYAAVNKDGNPVAMWAKMPWLMLGKTCEALALRRAFPAELSGVYTAEEMAQADNDLPAPLAHASTPPSAPARPAPTSRPASTVAPTPVTAHPVGTDERVAKALRNRTVLGLLNDLGVTDQAARRAKVAAAFAYLDKSLGHVATERDLMDALESQITSKRAKAKPAAHVDNDPAVAAIDHDPHDLQASGAFAGAPLQ